MAARLTHAQMRAARSEAKVTVRGIEDVVALLGRVKSAAERNLILATTAGAKVAHSAAVDLVPIRTGTLMRSISIDTVYNDQTRCLIGIGPDTPYDYYVEYGHMVDTKSGPKFVPGKPYMRPALYNNKPAIIRTVRRVLVHQMNAAKH